MADRSIHILGLRSSRKPLFLFFGFVALFFAFSWFYFFGFAVARAPIVGRSVLPSSKILSVVESRDAAPVTEIAGFENRQCDPERALLKVFMYDLPAEFHFGLLGWSSKGGEVWPDIKGKILDYLNGLNLQHNIEDSRQAGVIFVPFF